MLKKLALAAAETIKLLAAERPGAREVAPGSEHERPGAVSTPTR